MTTHFADDATLERLLKLEEENKRLVAYAERLKALLIELDERGGLGHATHDRIKEALGTPNGRFCWSARECLRAGRCCAPIACNE